MTPSATYKLFEHAIRQRRQIVCRYRGHRRELCPVILGHKQSGDEVALTFQFAGESRSGLPRGGEWRCLLLAGASNIELRDGAWHAGSRHRQPQSCVDIVDLDVNPSSPYKPRRRTKDVRP